MYWIDIDEQLPEYYKNLAIKLYGGCELHGWSMVSDIDRIYFISLDSDDVLYYEDVTHWAYL